MLSAIPKVSAQILRADLIAGEEHILTSSILSARAWKENRGIARSPATEILLYASGKRQINEAIATMGVGMTGRDGYPRWVIVAVFDSLSALEPLGEVLRNIGEENDLLIDLSDDKVPAIMETFGIDSKELSLAEKLASSRKALKSLVMERVALSEVYR
jgi:KEOPS complex subunit Cgi121